MSSDNTATLIHPKRMLNVVAESADARIPKSFKVESEKLRQLELSELLCKFLDAKRLIELFSNEIQADVPHDRMEFHNEELQVSLSLGGAARHRVEYKIVVGNTELGDIAFGRARLFSTRELDLIEQRLCCVVYPLRNALMYQLALESAFRDPLTGVNNRAALDSSLRREIDLARRHRTFLSLLVIDTDHFKEINDNHGHQVGDAVLKCLAGLLKECLRTTDLVYRYGGDEFVIALSNTDKNGAKKVAERIRERAEQCDVSRENVRVFVTVSIGLTELCEGDTSDTLFRRADEALLLAKRGGRNQVAVI